jgi:hypothetical protein
MNASKPKVPRRKPAHLLREEERCRLLFGPYEPPLVKRGFLVDEVRGQVPFDCFTNALIPWPKAKRRGRGGSGGIILCGDLLRALAHESLSAISHYWGVCRGTVISWRRWLGLTSQEHRTEGAERLVKLSLELSMLPESRAKIALAARGRKLSPGHKARLHSAMNQGWRRRFKARRAAFKNTGRFPKATKADPWIPEEDQLLSQLPLKELVRVLGRSEKSIRTRRKQQGFRIRAPSQQKLWAKRGGDFMNEKSVHIRAPSQQKLWEPDELQCLGADSDSVIAGRLGRSASSVENKRRQLGIPAANIHPWTAAEEALVGKLPDAEVARRLGRSAKAVVHRRLKMGMALYKVQNRRRWSAGEVALLGTDSDANIAKQLGRDLSFVAQQRRRLKIPVKPVRQAWTPEDLAVLGTMSDIAAARKLGRTVLSVSNKRIRAGIGAGCHRRWTAGEEKLLGTMSDEAAALKLGRGVSAVRDHRKKLHIPIHERQAMNEPGPAGVPQAGVEEVQGGAAAPPHPGRVEAAESFPK